MYCFSFFQKPHSFGQRKEGNFYLEKKVVSVNVPKTKDLFRGALTGNLEGVTKSRSCFVPYIKQKKVMQWGGLADGFDEHERKHGVSLELLRFFDEIDYPLSISTKGTWWTKDERYLSLLRKHNHNWHFKVSIITMNPVKAAGIERGVAPPSERIEAIRRIANTGCHVTLRLRPYIIGISDDWHDTIRSASSAGADSVTTEFFCLETRADDRLKAKYKEMSKFTGYDVWDFYKEYSISVNGVKESGYKRLNYNLKKMIIVSMRDYTHALGLRFYVSDAHHKEKSDYCCCCGVPPEWNVSHGHFAEALQIAKSRENGLVTWDDIRQDLHDIAGFTTIRNATGFNSSSDLVRADRKFQVLEDFVHEKWNTPKGNNSPYTYFSGILYPVGLDKNNNVIYKYNKKKAESK
jgi:DNA repair photolyase